MPRKRAIPKQVRDQLYKQINAGNDAAVIIGNAVVVQAFDGMRSRMVEALIACSTSGAEKARQDRDDCHRMVKAIDLLLTKLSRDESLGRRAQTELERLENAK